MPLSQLPADSPIDGIRLMRIDGKKPVDVTDEFKLRATAMFVVDQLHPRTRLSPTHQPHGGPVKAREAWIQGQRKVFGEFLNLVNSVLRNAPADLRQFQVFVLCGEGEYHFALAEEVPA